MSTINELSNNVKQYISNAKTDKAIAVLLDFFKTDPNQYNDLQRLTIQIQSEYSRFRNDELAGILTTEQINLAHNRINDKILSVLGRIERGELKNPNVTLPSNTKHTWMWIAIIGALLLAAVGIGYYLSKDENNNDKEDNTTTDKPIADVCPNFDPRKRFNVVALPFQNLGENKRNPHIQIASDINKLCTENNLPACAIADTTDYGIQTYEQAKKLATNCDAQMVVWGLYEVLPNGININVKYDVNDTVAQTSLLKLNGESGFKTVSSISALSQGNVSTNVENVIKILFSLVAYNNNDWKGIEKTLGVLPNMNLDTTMNQMLAEAYLRNGKSLKAIEQYNAYFDKGGKSSILRTNRAVLNCQDNQNYLSALQDLNTNLALNPNDTLALHTRSWCHLKLEMYDKAQEDVLAYQKVKPDSYWATTQEKMIASIIKNKETRIAKLNAVIAKEPNDKAARLARAKANSSIGKIEASREDVKAIQKTDPKNVEATAIEVKSHVHDQNIKEAMKVIKDAKSKGIDTKDLLKSAPILKPSDAVVKPLNNN